MSYHVVFARSVSRLIGQCQLNRAALVRLLVDVYQALENLPADFVRERSYGDDALFLFTYELWDRDRFHTFHFWVDDATATDYLFVVDLEHLSNPPIS